MSTHLKPVEVCELLFGGPEEVAVASGNQRKAAYGWRRASKFRDAGDIPMANLRPLLDHSDRHGLGLTATHLIRGASASEIDAILAARPSALTPGGKALSAVGPGDVPGGGDNVAGDAADVSRGVIDADERGAA